VLDADAIARLRIIAIRAGDDAVGQWFQAAVDEWLDRVPSLSMVKTQSAVRVVTFRGGERSSDRCTAKARLRGRNVLLLNRARSRQWAVSKLTRHLEPVRQTPIMARGG
jgi:hypothetical protein